MGTSNPKSLTISTSFHFQRGILGNLKTKVLNNFYKFSFCGGGGVILGNLKSKVLNNFHKFSLGGGAGYSWQLQNQSPEQFSFVVAVFLATSDPNFLSPPWEVPILEGGEGWVF